MKPTPTQIEALELCQKALSMMITPAQIDQTSTLQAFAIATEAEAKARAALSVPAAAVVGEPDKPICHIVWRQGRRAIDDVEDYYEVARTGDKSVDGSDPFPVYAAPSAPEGWHPIETAPRDGTVILALYQWGGESRFLVIRLSNMHRWWVTDHDGLIKHDEEKVSIRNYNFTHWRPLPAPPALGGKP